jgi:hypothetical protein
VHLRGVPLEGSADAAAAAAAAAGAPLEDAAAVEEFAAAAAAAGARALTMSEAAARLAAVTPGFNGAELANVVNEASLLAARGGKTEVCVWGGGREVKRNGGVWKPARRVVLCAVVSGGGWRPSSAQGVGRTASSPRQGCVSSAMPAEDAVCLGQGRP